MIPAAQLLRIDKSFPGVHALAEVDLTLRPGSIHALVGENGAGKSTLINILCGVLQPDGGDIRIAGRLTRFTNARGARRQGIVTVHQELDLFPDLTLVENIGLEQGLPTRGLGWIDWGKQRRRTRAALAAVAVDLPPAILAGALTPAQRQLVEIAAAVAPAAELPTRVLILDEPTSSLSEAETRILFRHLRRFRAEGAAILYVSHRLEEIFTLADEATVLRDGRNVWTGPSAESSPEHLIRCMVGRESRAECRESRAESPALDASLFALDSVLDSPRLSCRSLTAADGSFTDISLAVCGGEILGVYGLIGAGRSEWAQAVFGLRPIARGEVRIDGLAVRPRGPGQMIRHGVALVPEDRLRQGLCRGLSIKANLVLAVLRKLAQFLWVSEVAETRRARVRMDQLAIGRNSQEQSAGTLSGGNQQKVVLGRWLECDPVVLILDEPTRGVDVGAKAEIHALIQRFAREGRAVVLISSDLPEVLTQSERVAVFRAGRLVGTFAARQTSAEEIAAAALPLDKVARTGVAGAEFSQPRAFRAWRFLLAALPRESTLLASLLIFIGFLEWQTGRFLSKDNLLNLATEASFLSFCAVAAALVILAGGIDISLGALMALSAGVAGRLWEQGAPLPVVIATAILVGGAGGLLNALLTLIGRVHPIVVTLGTMSLYRGLTLWWIEQDVNIPYSARNWIDATVGFRSLGARPWPLGLPLIVWAGLAFAVLAWLLLNWTVSGRELYALGSNPAAAHRVGIERGRVWLKAFTIQGMLAGLAGLLYLAQSGSLQPSGYEDSTLQAIAAAVVGGVAITGGRGSVGGVILGCLFLVSLKPACTFLHIAATWQQALVGSVIAGAVLIDTFWRIRVCNQR